MAVAFRVYASTPSLPPAGPIDYTSPVATITTAPWTWTGPAITPGYTVRYAVRSFDTITTLESRDISSTVTVATNLDGSDPSVRPPAPASLTAVATAGGGASLAWSVAGIGRNRWPVGFHVYIGAGTTAPDFTTVAATFPARPYDGLPATRYAGVLGGLTAGVTYAVAVKGYNTVTGGGDGAASPVVYVTAKSSGPLAVTGAVAVTTGTVGR